MKTIKQIEVKVKRLKVPEDSPLYNAKQITTPIDAVEAVRVMMGDTDREIFISVPIDIRNKPIGFELVHLGTFDSCMVDPRSAFRSAVILGASGLIVAHNHPSGNAKPSIEDIALTKRLQKAGDILGIPLLDHLVITNEDYTSLAEAGIVERV